MLVSVALHTQSPPENGNQRQYEASYGGYNRQYAELLIDPETGNGSCEIRDLCFPKLITDPLEITHFSLGVCFAPEGWGGATIIGGPLAPSIAADVGVTPTIQLAACSIFRERLELLRLVIFDGIAWRELTEAELRGSTALITHELKNRDRLNAAASPSGASREMFH